MYKTTTLQAIEHAVIANAYQGDPTWFRYVWLRPCTYSVSEFVRIAKRMGHTN